MSEKERGIPGAWHLVRSRSTALPNVRQYGCISATIRQDRAEKARAAWHSALHEHRKTNAAAHSRPPLCQVCRHP